MEQYLAGIVIGIVVGAAGDWLRVTLFTTPRLRWAISHQFAFAIDPAKGAIAHTRSLIIANAGRVAATDLEIVMDFQPQMLQVHPPKQWEAVALPNAHGVKFKNLGPREEISIEMLAVAYGTQLGLPIVREVRSNEGRAEIVPVMPMRIVPTWIRRTIAFFLIIGAATVLVGIAHLLNAVARQMGWG